MKVLKAKEIDMFKEAYYDVYIINCLDSAVLEHYIRHNKVIKILDEGNIIYLNPKNLISYQLYDGMYEIEE